MSIQEHLNKIRNAVFGSEVRESIAKGIETAYNDASEKDNANMEVKMARGTNPNLNTRLNKMDEVDRQTTAQLAQKADEHEVVKKGFGTLSDFDEPTRAAIQGLEPGEINAVLGKENVREENIAPAAVSPDKTTFLAVSTNLVGDQFVYGYSIAASTGKPTPLANYYLSDFIKMNPYTAYSGASLSRWALYDADKKFIISATSQSIPNTYNAHYIRLVVHTENYSANTHQLNEGDTLKPYEPYHKPKYKLKDSIPGESLQNGTVDKNKINFITRSDNLIDTSANMEEGVTIGPGGVKQPRDGVGLSDFIPVKPSTMYSVKSVDRILFYNSNKEFLRFFEAQNIPNAFNTYNSGAYLRLVVRLENYDKAQLNEGEEPKPYQPFGYLLDSDIHIHKPEDEGLNLDLWEEDRYILEGVTEGVYESPVIDTVPTLNTYKPEDFYALYDGLVTAHPEYVTRTLQATNTLGNPIYRYDFKPHPVPTVSVNEGDRLDTKYPKIVLVSGVHGYEKAAIYHLYTAMKAICENWREDPLLETLRWNAHFIIMPCVSDYGIRNSVRGNENGVDIARNFPVGWTSNPAEPGAATYGGTEPFSEIESQAIDAVLKENLRDTILFNSLHTFSGTNGRFIWVPGATKLQITLGKSLVSKMSRLWKNRYNWLPQDEVIYFGYSDNGAPVGSEGRYGASLGIQSATFETSRLMDMAPDKENYSSVSLTMGCESIMNWLVMNLRENTAFYNKYRS